MRSIGTAWPAWEPPYPTSDEIIRLRFEKDYSFEARWKVGRDVWIRMLQLKDAQGCYLYPWSSLFDESIKLYGLGVDIVDGDGICIREPAVGSTERLPRICRECREHLPGNAHFCIACGAPVE